MCSCLRSEVHAPELRVPVIRDRAALVEHAQVYSCVALRWQFTAASVTSNAHTFSIPIPREGVLLAAIA